MLAESINKAFSTADRLVSLAKKSPGAMIPAALNTAASGGAATNQNRIDRAAQQYERNRGWVYACVRLIAQRLAAQRIFVARENSTPRTDGMMTKAVRDFLPRHLKSMAGRLEPLPSHPILDLLADPNELGVAWGLMFSTVASLELTGRSLWYISEENGKPTIFPVPTSWIEEVDKKRTAWIIRIPGGNGTIPLPGDSVVYTFYPSPANPWGALSPLQAIAGAVNADEAITLAQWRTFSAGQNPGLILTAGHLPAAAGTTGQGPRVELTPDQRNQLINAVRRAYGGVMNSGEPLILDALIEKVEKLSFTPLELDFLASAKLTKSKILQGYGVSPILLGEIEGANRASSIIADEIFCANKVNPLLQLLQQTLNAWLVPMFQRDGEKLTLWIDEARAHDDTLEFRKWTLAASKDYITPNEYRKYIGLPQIAGGDELPEPSAPPAVDAAALKSLLGRNPYLSRSNVSTKRSKESLARAARQ